MSEITGILTEALIKLKARVDEIVVPEAIKGDQGEQGEKGEKGDNGLDGKDGQDGKDGIDGKDGKDGIDGKDGKDGRDGVDGKDGADGQDGVDGRDGVDGKDGKDGRAGYDGLSIKGDKGDMPKHEWQGTKLKFELPDGKWGKAVDLAGRDGVGRFLGGSTGVQRLTSTGNTVQITQDGTTFNLETSGSGITEITSLDGSLVVTQDGTVANVQVSEASPASTILAAVRNTTGATLTKGTVVYISGAAGNKATVSKAIATSDATSAQTLGLITADLANNSNGYVTVMGQLVGLDTSAFTEGDQLYLSGTVAGAYTATKTLAPTHLVYIGVVTRSHANQGAIEVKVQNGYELEELHNVSLISETNNQVLVYESATDLWKNKTIDYSWLTGTPTIPSAVSQLTNDSGFITGYTETDPVFVAHAAYNITTTKISNWDTAYGWGNHADQNYTKNNIVNTFSQPQIIAGSFATSAALQIIQVGAGNALLVEDSTSPDATPTVIDNAGRLFVGSALPYTIAGTTAKRVQSHSVGGDAGFSSAFWGNSASGTTQQMMKSRGVSVGDYSAVQQNDVIGTLMWGGADGTQFAQCANITAVVDGTVATNSVPAGLRFATTLAGNTAPTERLRITSNGAWGLGGANYGTSGNYAIVSNGSVNPPTWQQIVTPTSSETLTNKTITGLKQTSAASSGNNFDLATANYFTHTVSGATTFTVTNTASSGSVSSFILDLTNGGSAAITWWANMKWVAGTAPILTASGRDVLEFFTNNGGTTWTGLVIGKDVK